MLLVVIEKCRKEGQDEGEGQEIKEEADEDNQRCARVDLRICRGWGRRGSIFDGILFVAIRLNLVTTSQMNCHCWQSYDELKILGNCPW